MKINPVTKSVSSMRWIVVADTLMILGGQHSPQERVAQRRLERDLLVVRGAGVSALDVLVVEDLMICGLQGRRHLAGVARMHAVVSGGGGHQHRRVVSRRRNIMVGRIFGDEFPVR